MSTTFENARVGDRCFAPVFGPVDKKKQNATFNARVDRQLLVQGDNGRWGHFNFGGCQHTTDCATLQELFWSQPIFIAPEEPKRMKTITSRNRIVMKHGELGYYPVAYSPNTPDNVHDFVGYDPAWVDLGIKEFTFEVPE